MKLIEQQELVKKRKQTLNLSIAMKISRAKKDYT